MEEEVSILGRKSTKTSEVELELAHKKKMKMAYGTSFLVFYALPASSLYLQYTYLKDDDIYINNNTYLTNSMAIFSSIAMVWYHSTLKER